MGLGTRLALLGATGVGVAGLAQTGWWALLWAAQPADGGLMLLWLPLLGQVALTLAVAAAVAWHVQRHVRDLRSSLALLQDQALALEQGRFVVVEDPPLAEAVPLARSLNAALRRLQAGEPAPSAAGDTLRRMQRSDVETGFDSRFTFLRRLTDRLAARDCPETALVVLRSPSGAMGEPALCAAMADALQSEQRHEPDTFAGRLSETEVALCLPVHGEAARAAERVAVLLATAGAQDWLVTPVDGLGGASLSQALQAIDAAASGTARTAAAASAGAEAGPDADGADEHAELADTLRAGRVRLGEFPVLDPYGQLLHLECPLRLQRRPGGPFEPAARWLPAVQRARLTTQVDLAAIEHALAAIAADGVGRCVHVAAESLATAEFVSSVRSRLEHSRDAARRLWIEIAEVSFERLPTRLRNAGTVWRRCGARVGIEHAGAALRGLVRLGELDLDYVKIDGSFVRGLAHDAEQREWARGLVAFAHELGASVYAEGVDAADDLSEVWTLGFDGATGQAVTEWQRREAAVAAQAMSPA